MKTANTASPSRSRTSSTATSSLDYKFSDNWSLTLADSIGWNRSSLDGFKQFCAACATLALNGTTQSSGSTTASSVPGQNVVVLQLPLTTSNALDVWNTGAANRTNPLVMDSLYTANTQNNNYNTFNQFRAVVQGDLFDLPAGPVKTCRSAASTCGRSSNSS